MTCSSTALWEYIQSFGDCVFVLFPHWDGFLAYNDRGSCFNALNFVGIDDVGAVGTYKPWVGQVILDRFHGGMHRIFFPGGRKKLDVIHKCLYPEDFFKLNFDQGAFRAHKEKVFFGTFV